MKLCEWLGRHDDPEVIEPCTKEAVPGTHIKMTYSGMFLICYDHLCVVRKHILKVGEKYSSFSIVSKGCKRVTV